MPTSTCHTRQLTPQLWSKKGFPRCRIGARRRNFRRECRAALAELFDPVTASRSVLNFSRVVASSSPAQLRPVIDTLGSDLAGIVSLKPTLGAAGHLAVRCSTARLQCCSEDSWLQGCCRIALDPTTGLLQGIWYAFLATPSPIYGILDFYFLDPIGRLLQRKWTVADLSLRDRMGSGNYGQVRDWTCKPTCTSLRENVAE